MIALYCVCVFITEVIDYYENMLEFKFQNKQGFFVHICVIAMLQFYNNVHIRIIQVYVLCS